MKNKKKQPNYKLRSKVYKGIGLTSIGVTTSGSFIGYQMLTDFEQFKNEFDNFMVVQEEGLKLNMAIAIPVLIGLIVFLFVALKKNKTFFADKISMNLFFSIAIFYLIYSVIEIVLVSLIGAFIGAIIDEFVFMPLSKKNNKAYEEKHEEDLEYNREIRRIQARAKAQRDGLNGSV